MIDSVPVSVSSTFAEVSSDVPVKLLLCNYEGFQYKKEIVTSLNLSQSMNELKDQVGFTLPHVSGDIVCKVNKLEVRVGDEFRELAEDFLKSIESSSVSMLTIKVSVILTRDFTVSFFITSVIKNCIRNVLLSYVSI